MERLSPHVNNGGRYKLKEMIKEFVPEYKPFMD